MDLFNVSEMQEGGSHFVALMTGVLGVTVVPCQQEESLTVERGRGDTRIHFFDTNICMKPSKKFKRNISTVSYFNFLSYLNGENLYYNITK